MFKRLAFHTALLFQWLLALPWTLYASERFENTYEYVDIDGAKQLMLTLPADPDAVMSFAVSMTVLIALTMLLLWLRPHPIVERWITAALALLPPIAALFIRIFVGCITCMPPQP